MAEHRDEVVIIEDLALDLFGQPLSLGGIIGSEIAIVFGVEVLHAKRIGGQEAAAFEVRLVPIGPAGADAGAGEDDVDPGPLLEAGLQPLCEDATLQGLEPAADTDRLELRQDPLAARIVNGYRSQPINLEAVRIAGFGQQFFGLGDIVRPIRTVDRILHVVIDPVAVDLPHSGALGLVYRLPVDSQAHRLAHAFVVERVVGILETGEFEPEIGREDRRQDQLGIIPHPLDQFPRQGVDDVGFAALEHRHPGGGVRHTEDREALYVDRAVVILESLELEPGSCFLRDQPVGSGADRLLGKPVRSDFLVILSGDDPAGAADIGRAEQPWEIEKRPVEGKTQRVVVNDLDTVGLVVQHLGPSAAVVLVAPFDVFRRDRSAIVEFEARAQPESRAPSVFGKLIALGECRVVVEFLTKVLDQGVVHGIEKIIRRGPAVVLLRVEPAGRDIGMPRQHHAAASSRFRGGLGNPYKGRSERCRRQRRRSQQRAPSGCRLPHQLLRPKQRNEESGAPVRWRACRKPDPPPFHRSATALSLPRRFLLQPCAKCSSAMQECLAVLHRNQLATRGSSPQDRHRWRQEPGIMVFC